jgi:outer membrane protein assembly factor BamB
VRPTRLLAACCLLLTATAFTRADNWPQWRGPENNGISKETNLPAEWGETKNLAWKLKLPGMAGSTPVIWGERIFLTSADGKDVVLLCANTGGRELWKQKLGPGGGSYFRGEGNDASASPCTDGERVYAFTGNGDLAAFDLDGKEVWKFNAQDRYGKFRIMHGMHVTPLLHGDRLYLSLLHSNGSWVVALEAKTGKEVWKVERKTDGRGEGEHSYASPCLWRRDKDELLVVHGCDYTTAHKLDDGSEVWRLGDLNPKGSYNPTLRLVASPVATPDLIVVPTAKNGPVVGVKPGATGLIKTGGEFEQWRLPRGTPDVPSPIVHDGLVYLCNERGYAVCLDAKSGKEHYNERIHADRYRASPVLADGKVIVTARGGTFTVYKTGPKFEVVATNRLPDQFTASPVISNGRIYLRGFDALYAVSQDGK